MQVKRAFVSKALLLYNVGTWVEDAVCQHAWKQRIP